MQREIWLRTNELNESIISLRMLADNLQKVLKDIYTWKLVIILLHNTLQGFIVCSLKGTNNFNILRNDSLKKVFKALNNESDKYPDEKLDHFLNLYQKIKNNKYMNCIFKSNSGIDYSVERLNVLRNEFIHFVPKGWSIEVSGMPSIVRDCMSIILFLVFESNSIIHMESNDYVEIKYLVESITEINNEIFRNYID